jgi:hypothetical protein
MAFEMLCWLSMRLLALVPILAACASSADEPTPDVGAYRRLVVDDFTLPTTQDQVKALGSDLDGDGNPDNALGALIAALATQADIRDDAQVRAALGSGAVTSSLELFGSDALFGLQYFGSDGEASSSIRATALDDATVATDGLLPASLTLALPALVDCDPTLLAVDYVQMQLAPDGSDGFDVHLQGLVDPTETRDAVCNDLVQMIANDPSQHQGMIDVITDNDNGSASAVTMVACLNSSGIQNLLTPDVLGPDKQPHISIGIALHVFTPRNVPPFE